MGRVAPSLDSQLCVHAARRRLTCSCGAEVVNGVSNYESKTFRNWIAKTNLDGNLSIRITADTKRVGVTIHEGGKGRLKIADVMLGPL